MHLACLTVKQDMGEAKILRRTGNLECAMCEPEESNSCSIVDVGNNATAALRTLYFKRGIKSSKHGTECPSGPEAEEFKTKIQLKLNVEVQLIFDCCG